MRQKGTFQLILAGAIIFFLLLPFTTTFNSILTELVNRLEWYVWIEKYVVPFEARIVIVLLRMLGIPAFFGLTAQDTSLYFLKESTYFPVKLEWNCLGWQSFLLLVASFAVGLRGAYSKKSVLSCVIIGVLGTFLINILRMVFITAGIYYVNTVFALLIHDYFAAFVTLAWLVIFWWFAYRYVLIDVRVELIHNNVI